MKKLAYFYVLLAAVLWGILGIFIKKLYGFELNAFQIVAIRAMGAFLMLFVYLSFKDRRLFHIHYKDTPYFVGTGIVSFVFFNWCYFMAIQHTSLSTASVLLYTAPVFVMALSTLLFRETLTRRKLLSCLLTFIGCILVTGYFQGDSQTLSLLGVMAGLGSGLGYGLYSIFSRYALKKYDSMTVIFYTFLFASLGLIPFVNLPKMASLLSNPTVLFYGIALSLLCTVFPFILYTKGLTQLESSRASIIATLEPVVATIVSMTIFQERIGWSSFIGIFVVLGAITLIHEKTSEKDASSLPLEI